MFFIKKTVTFLLFMIIVGCATENITKFNSINEKGISIDTPNNKYNVLFKEYLKRKFNNEKKLKTHFILKADISFDSNETLSVRGLSALNSTSAVVKYSLIDSNSNFLIKSGSIKSFPTLSSLSNSLYSNERSLNHIKERLSQSLANKLYVLTNVILRKLIEN